MKKFHWVARWRMWRQRLIHFHLFEVAGIKAWVALIAIFSSRGIRSPMCLQRISYAELMADWEAPHPDMSIWIWQADRHNSARCWASRQRAEFTSPGDFHAVIPTPLGRIRRRRKVSGPNTPVLGANSHWRQTSMRYRCRVNFRHYMIRRLSRRGSSNSWI